MSGAGMASLIALLLLPMMVYARSQPWRRPNIPPKDLGWPMTPLDTEVEDGQTQFQVPEKSLLSAARNQVNWDQILASLSESGEDSSEEGSEEAKRGLSSKKGKSKIKKWKKKGGPVGGLGKDLVNVGIATGIATGLNPSLGNAGYGGGEVYTNQGYVQGGNSPQYNPYQNRASRP